MNIKTNTASEKARKGVMEFLQLTTLWIAQFVIKEECDLQDQSMYYGDKSRFVENKRQVKEKYMAH